jgi:hypothetical protein
MWSKDVSGSLGSRVLCCEGLVGIPRRIRTARDIKKILERGRFLKVYFSKQMHHFGYFLVELKMLTSSSPGMEHP